MARYRKIDVRIWNDRKFKELDDNAKLAFLLLLTHPDTNQLGFIRSRSVSLAFDLGWQSDAMSNAIQTLCQMGMLMADEKAGLMFLPNFLKYNPPNGVNGAKSWAGLLDLLPECDLRDQALIHLKPLIDGLPEGTREGIPEDIMNAIRDAIRNGNPQPSRIQEQEQKQEQEHKEVVAAPATKPKAKREPVVPFPDALPEEWRQAALEVRTDVTPERVFLKLRGRFAPTTSKKTMGNWRKIFLGWIGREYPETGKPNAAAKALPPHKDPAFHFDDNYYADAIKPDGTTDWGI
jgi:hypothetical protein